MQQTVNATDCQCNRLLMQPAANATGCRCFSHVCAFFRRNSFQAFDSVQTDSINHNSTAGFFIAPQKHSEEKISGRKTHISQTLKLPECYLINKFVKILRKNFIPAKPCANTSKMQTKNDFMKKAQKPHDIAIRAKN